MSGATRTEPGRGLRGWGGAAALALATLLLWSLHPTLLILVPLALLLVALPPRRPPLIVGAALLIWFVFSDSGMGPLWLVERGWVLLLGAWFIAFGAMWPQRPFIARGLAAVAATMATAALVVASGHAGPFVDGLVSERLRMAASESSTVLMQIGAFERMSEQMSEAFYAAADLQVLVFPALLALGSLTGLAVAWFIYRRVGLNDVAPLRPLREFRFPDDLVWVLIAGMLLLLLPLGAGAERAGTNLLAFMAALYALRGLAVLLVVAGMPGPFGMVVGGVLVVFLYPLIMAMTVLVGVTDTWLDIRARRASVPPSS